MEFTFDKYIVHFPFYSEQMSKFYINICTFEYLCFLF